MRNNYNNLPVNSSSLNPAWNNKEANKKSAWINNDLNTENTKAESYL